MARIERRIDAGADADLEHAIAWRDANALERHAAGPGCRIGPKIKSYTDASLSYTPSTKSFSMAMTDSAWLPTSGRNSSFSRSNSGIRRPLQP